MPIKISGATSGSATLIPVDSGPDVDLTLPDHEGTIQTEVDLAAQKGVVDEELAVAVADTPKKNMIINGAFQWWQRATSYSAGAGGYVAPDRFIIGAYVNASRIYENQYKTLKLTRYDANCNILEFGQGIEIYDPLHTGEFTDKTYTLSYDVRVNGDDKDVLCKMDFVDAVGYAPNKIAILPLTTMDTINESEGWKRVSITLTIGSTNVSTNKALQISMGVGNDGFGVVDAFDVAFFRNVKFEESPVATTFEKPDITLELSRCQRYYWKGSAPGEGWGQVYSDAGNDRMVNCVSFPVTMAYKPAGGYTGGAGSNCVHNAIGTDATGLYHRVNVTTTGIFRFPGATYWAEAEL